jgi:hypothetical protein
MNQTAHLNDVVVPKGPASAYPVTFDHTKVRDYADSLTSPRGMCDDRRCRKAGQQAGLGWLM